MTPHKNKNKIQEIYKSNRKRGKEQGKGVKWFPLFFYRSPNVDIFAEFLAFDEELNEVAQALDNMVAHLLPPAPNQDQPQQGHTQTPSHTYFIILRVNQTVTMKLTQISLGEKSRTFHHSGI